MSALHTNENNLQEIAHQVIANKIPQKHLDEMLKAAREDAAHAFGSTRTDAATAPRKYRLDGGVWRADAAESFFVARQLEFMRPGIYAVQYPALKAQRLIPFNMGVDTGAQQFTATAVDQVGAVAITADMAFDVPMVEVKTIQMAAPIYHLSLGYEYSLQEARAAMFAKVPLIPQKALRTREQMERKLDDIAFLGDATTGMVGLLSASGTATYSVPANGQGGDTHWKNKAPDDVLVDMNGAVNQVIVTTKEIEIPNTMVLPLSAKTFISNRRVGDGTSLTILKYFLENQEFVKEVEGTYKAETAGTGSGTRGCCYVKDPTRLEFVVPQPFEQLPPEARGYMIRTICHMRTAGLMLYLPQSVIYFDLI